MTEQRKCLEQALRECAERWMPETEDPWPYIRERVSGERVGANVSGEQSGDERASIRPRLHHRPSSLVPNTPLGLALALLSVLILGVGAYAASGPVSALLRSGLPGPAGPGVGGHKEGEQPEAERSGLRTQIGQTHTADGARVTLDWAYADERFVAVALHTQNLGGTGVLEPSLWDDTVGNEAELPPHVQITDASGQDFATVGGGTRGDRADAVFDAPEGFQPGREHRFRLEVPLHASRALSGEPEAGPFFFVFEVPVLPAPTIEVDQEVEANGIVLTLERVVNSPVLPQAVVCFEPPDDEHHHWTPWLKHQRNYDPDSAGKVWSAPQKLGDGCWSLQMEAPLEGHSSVTVAYLEGMPRNPKGMAQGDSSTGTTMIYPKRIHGPWTFEFEAPGP